MEVLCSLDTYLLDFINGSGITILAVLAVLKGLAACTPSVVDDKIVTMLSGVFSSIKPAKKEVL